MRLLRKLAIIVTQQTHLMDIAIWSWSASNGLNILQLNTHVIFINGQLSSPHFHVNVTFANFHESNL